jgi:hypothetical protein
VDSESPGKNNPLARHRAVVLGEAQPPRWQPLEFFLAMGDHPLRCDGGIFLEEEETGHPEQIPLLALRQVDDEGRVWGEVWLSPSDLIQLIAGLREEWDLNFAPRDRRWRGLPDGPLQNLGLGNSTAGE